MPPGKKMTPKSVYAFQSKLDGVTWIATTLNRKGFGCVRYVLPASSASLSNLERAVVKAAMKHWGLYWANGEDPAEFTKTQWCGEIKACARLELARRTSKKRGNLTSKKSGVR